MVYTLRFFFSSKRSLFHNSNLFDSCIIHILYTGCAKIKKNNSGALRLRGVWSNGGMVLTGETEVLGEKHYTAWVVGGWLGMEQWWNDTDRGN
jgi:hypothetical protein